MKLEDLIDEYGRAREDDGSDICMGQHMDYDKSDELKAKLLEAIKNEKP